MLAAIVSITYRFTPLAQLYWWKEDNICQSIWDKSEVLWRTCSGTHWELGEHIENLMRTHWELKRNIDENTLGPGEKWKKKPSPLPRQKLKREKSKAPWVYAWAKNYASHWLHKISLPKRVHHHFWPGLYPVQRTSYLLINWLYLLQKTQSTVPSLM